MAKRKRLTPPFAAAPDDGDDPSADPAIPSGAQPFPDRSLPGPASRGPAVTRAPIAQVAGDAAAQSALDALADEMHAARAGGRLVQSIALDAITEDHLVRDRMVIDEAEMAVLKSSIAARGQQTPIEVVDLGAGRFGLISGWRRLHALRALHGETAEARFATIEALIKPIDTVSDSYVAMVEENEIRSGLSFYERAHLACEAVRLGVYPTPARAVQVLFANAAAPKRSKILSFVRLHEMLGQGLRFPTAVPERLGLALVAALGARPSLTAHLNDALCKTPARSAEQERETLERALRMLPSRSRKAATDETVPGIALTCGKQRLVLTGRGVDAALQRDLEDWLRTR